MAAKAVDPVAPPPPGLVVEPYYMPDGSNVAVAITLNRPKAYNSMDNTLLEELRTALNDISK